MSTSLERTVEATEGVRVAGASNILLTTTNRWPSSARLMIEFSRLGHVVSILCPSHGHPSEKVRVPHRTFPYKALTPLASLAAAIEATKPEIILPCDDLAVRHLHRLHASKRARSSSGVDIPALIARSLGPPNSYPVVDSRYLLLQIACEEGIRTPATSVIANLRNLEQRRLDSPFPWVLKADGTAAGFGVRIAPTLGEAQSCFSDLRRSIGLLRLIKHLMVDRDLILENQCWSAPRHVRPVIVAQAFIRGSAANCAVVCWKGEVLAGVGCVAMSTESPVGPATVVRLVDNAEMMDAARRIARRLSLSGFFGLDFIIEETTGLAYLIEMNPRCTPPSHLRLGTGRDMIGALSTRLGGNALCEPVSITQNDLIAYFPQASLGNSAFLSSSYHDVPEREPQLIEELLRPSSDRGLINNVIRSVRRQVSSLNRRTRGSATQKQFTD